jgi:ABC-type amino acid transport substrate-binding protein
VSLILYTYILGIVFAMEQNFDAVVGDVTIVSGRYQHAEFTHPYTESGLVMIVPVISKTSNRAWLFMKPFTMAMWLLIGAINVYNGFVIWLLERNNCPELKGSVINQMGMLIWLAFNTLFSINGNRILIFLLLLVVSNKILFSYRLCT